MSHPLKTHFEPQVPDVILNQAKGDIDRYLLEQIDIMRQQNEAQIDVTLSIEAQTKLTNGRVGAHDLDIKRLQDSTRIIQKIKEYWKILTVFFVFIGPALMVIFVKLVDLVFHKFWP